MSLPAPPGERGREMEERALAWLQARGLKLVTRNFRCKLGEIDLILRDGAELVFVEVRARKSATHGGAAASITGAKQRRLLHTAQFYLQRLPSQPPCRFDVLAFEGEQVHWLRSAIHL